MPPRREHGGRVEGVIPEDFRTLQRQMQRGINLPVRDESKDEEEVEKNVGEEVVLNLEEERLFKAIYKIIKRPKFEIPTFLGNLNPEELINWINELEQCFEYEDIEDPDRVKFVKEKLKGCAKL